VQDAFVKVLGRFHDLRNKDAFWWYLRRTIVNLASSTFAAVASSARGSRANGRGGIGVSPRPRRT
jgi:DNA-directed RNA polymerase specialized sigma24 family protein